MPQMSPLPWVFLATITLSILLLTISLMHFSSKMKSDTPHKLLNSPMTYKW